MRIELSPAVFASPDSLIDILTILREVYEGRHDWQVSPESAQAGISYLRRHAKEFADLFAEFSHKSLVEAAWRGPRAGSVVEVEPDRLREYARDLCRPAQLVVEDEESDGNFLRAVFVAFSASRLLLALEKDWLEIRHGGGGSLAKVAADAATKFTTTVRVAALLDSDRLIPGQRTGSHVKADHLQGLGVRVHVLTLREAENYAPTRILAIVGQRAETYRRIGHLKKLSPEQRGHYDMKSGFRSAGGKGSVPAAQEVLYRDVGEATVRGLGEGFGKGILKAMREHAGSLTVEDFDKIGPGVADELEMLMKVILEVI
ncbi:hypothetical protein ACGFXC_32315 [Streptomyces sp. NPDC048507]|uniref:hypothetical protein n=1 Tax=Streptomyces sp. NPDC048507 TaxID=3365560 RepID=UPI00371542D9